MRKHVLSVLSVWLLASVHVHAQGMAAELEQAAATFERWMRVMGEVADEVKLEEADFERYLELHDSMSELDLLEPEQEESDVQPQEFVETVLADSRYKAWAGRHGVEPRAWLATTMRINMLTMQESYQQSGAMQGQQLEQQRQQLEQMRQQMGEEAYQQAQQMLEAAQAMGSRMRAAMAALPRPSGEELALYKRYQSRLLALEEEDDSADSWGGDGGAYDEGDDME